MEIKNTSSRLSIILLRKELKDKLSISQLGSISEESDKKNIQVNIGISLTFWHFFNNGNIPFISETL